MESKTQSQNQINEDKIEFLIKDLEKIKQRISEIDFKEVEEAYQEALKLENGWKKIFMCLYSECTVTLVELDNGKRIEFTPFDKWNTVFIEISLDSSIHEALEKLKQTLETNTTKFVAITAEKLAIITSSLRNTLEKIKAVKDKIERIEAELRYIKSLG